MNGSFKVVLKACKIRVQKNPLCAFFPFPEFLRITAYSHETLENTLFVKISFQPSKVLALRCHSTLYTWWREKPVLVFPQS